MSSKKILSFLFLLAVPFSSTLDATAWIKAGFWYAGSEFPVPEIPSTMYTHLHFAFAYINTSNFELYVSHSDETYISTFSSTVKQKNPSVITLLSILAGRDESSNFFAMVSQLSRRKSFITTSIKTARQYGFQGLDLFGVNPNTAVNMINMRSFIEEWRIAINSESKSSGTRRLILTMGASYAPMLDSMPYPVDTIVRNFDWVHVIAYDYYLPTKDNFTGAHAALYDPASNRNTDYGIKEWIKGGLPANNIVLGLPYHGYAWTLVNAEHNTVGSPAKGLAITRDGSMSYRYIKQYIKSYGAIPVFNSTFVVNYVIIGLFWIGYDDVEAIRTKVSYAKDKGLLGIAAFQIPSDDVDWELSKEAQDEEEENQTGSNRRLLAILLPTLSITLLLISTIVYILKKNNIRSEVIRELSERVVGRNMTVFSFDQIKAATDNFSVKNKLGEGGFGPVYKGRLSNGQEIAVKRLSKCSKQGIEEFQNEVTLASKLQHVNILQLHGFCIEREEKILIYECMRNKSLDFYLYDPVKSLQLDWETRVHIIEGVTQGLLYLQEYSTFTVIHRDLKPSNILLDDEMKPKISDFGIAKLFQKDEKEANTGRIVGTYGCVPPEYIKQGVYSRKYDVYSFGVLLLQILGGKKNSCEYGMNNLNLLDYAYELWQQGNGMNFIDLSLRDNSQIDKQLRCMQVALLCVQEKWEDRPSMLEVNSMLKNETEVLSNPKVPAFSKNKDNMITLELACSDNSLTISQLMAR